MCFSVFHQNLKILRLILVLFSGTEDVRREKLPFVDSKNLIKNTIEREHMHVTQTPQGFEYKTLIKAHREKNILSKFINSINLFNRIYSA